MRAFFSLMTGLTLLGVGIASAATTTASFTVTASLQSTCSATATALAFSAYTPGGGAIANNSTISVKCTKTTPYSVALNAGSSSGGTLAQRLMAFGVNRLQYNLFTSATFAAVFGDGTGSTVTNSGTGAGLGSPVTLTVYGQLPDSPANQAAVPGSYSDTITVTVTY